jgi:hypothetical protein
MDPLGINFAAEKAIALAETRKRKAIELAAAKDKVCFYF